MKRIAVAALLAGSLLLVFIVLWLVSPGRHPGAEPQSPVENSALPRKPEVRLAPYEVKKRFADIVSRISKPLINGREKVTGLELGDPKDPDGGPITVRIAAVHWLSCECCSADVPDTSFYNADLELVLAADNIGHLTVNRTRITDEGLRTISRHENLTHLDLAQNKLTDAGLAHLGRLKNLRTLNLNGNRITGSGLQHLAGLENLEELHLNDTAVEDGALRHLSSLAKLRKLTLSRTPLSGAGFAQVAGIDRLEEIDLSGASCTDKGLARLPEFPGLKRIDLSATRAGNRTLAALSRSSGLEEINLYRTAISDEGLASLSGMKHLRSLNLSDTAVTDDGLAHLGTVTTLEVLQFGKTGIRGPGICHLHDCLGLKNVYRGEGPDGAIEADERTLSTLARFRSVAGLRVRIAGHAKPAAVDFRDMEELRHLEITCSEPVDQIELSNLPKLNSLAVRHPGLPSLFWGGEKDGKGPTPRVGRIAVSNVGDDSSSMTLGLVMPDELQLQGIGRLSNLWVWGDVQAEHAAELAALPFTYSAKLDCRAGSDPAAVARILTAPDARKLYDLELAVEQWDEAWSDAIRDVRSPLSRVTVRADKIIDGAPIALGGFTHLEDLTLRGITAERLILENLNPDAQELKLEDVRIGELRLVECCVQVACREVHRLDRLVIDGIPPGKKYVDVFSTFGDGRSPVRSPAVLEMHNIRDLYVCSLNHPEGLQRIEVYGDGENFGEFQEIPKSVQAMIWKGRSPGDWQGEFWRRSR